MEGYMFTRIKRAPTALALGVSLALAAGAAPASARLFDLNANGSYARAASVSMQALNSSPGGSAILLGQTPSASRVVRPNPDEQTRQSSDTGAWRHVRVAPVQRCPVRGLCISSDSMLTQGLSEEQAAALGYSGGRVASTTGSRTDGLSPRGHSPAVTSVSSGGTFEWGDVGIGVAGTLLLVSAGVAVAVMTRRRRHRVMAS
jgi:hypothetical protein